MPDGRRFVVAGAKAGDKYGLYVVDPTSESARRLTTAEMWGDAYRPFTISPDGSLVAAMNCRSSRPSCAKAWLAWLSPFSGRSGPTSGVGLRRMRKGAP